MTNYKNGTLSLGRAHSRIDTMAELVNGMKQLKISETGDIIPAFQSLSVSDDSVSTKVVKSVQELIHIIESQGWCMDPSVKAQVIEFARDIFKDNREGAVVIDQWHDGDTMIDEEVHTLSR